MPFPPKQPPDILTGTFANRPGAGLPQRLYLPTDAPALYRADGSAWVAFGPLERWVPPVDSGFSWENQGGATLTAEKDSLLLVTPADTSMNLRVRYKTAPAAPYTITARFQPVPIAESYLSYGLVFRQSSDGKMHALMQEVANVYSRKYTNATTTGTADYPSFYSWEQIQWFRIADDNTNRILSVSRNGLDWTVIHTVGRTDYLTADQVGFFACGYNSSPPDLPMRVRLVSWEQS